MAENKIDDGGSAFPHQTNQFGEDMSGGMTLRDWFAGQAMVSIIAATSAGQHRVLFGDNGDSIETAMAKDAYQVADAMIAARKGGA